VLIKFLHGHPVIFAIIGPRQVGKTTLAKTIILESEDSMYLDLESPRGLSKILDAE
jgi:hypothetical protein